MYLEGSSGRADALRRAPPGISRDAGARRMRGQWGGTIAATGDESRERGRTRAGWESTPIRACKGVEL